MKNIASIVTNNQAAIDKAFAEGLHIAGERYVLAKAEDGSIYARKVCRLRGEHFMFCGRRLWQASKAEVLTERF